MTPAIEPLRTDDLPALGRFLAEGFGIPVDAPFASPDVLAWKYLGPRPPGDDRPRSFVARDESGRIVGHVGVVLADWRLIGAGDGPVPTLHMVDWLAYPAQRGIGTSLMRRAHALAGTQYVLGGSVDSRRVVGRAGYVLRPPLPVFRRVLRPLGALRGGGAWPGRAARAARDGLRLLLDRPRRAGPAPTLRPVERFGAEVEAVLDRAEGPLAFTDRGPEALNARLDYPRGGPTGWLLERAGEVEGFAVLNVLAAGGPRVGRIVELFLLGRDPGRWASGFARLADQLTRLGADAAVACGSTPWEAEGLRLAGFRPAYDLDFHLRDRAGRLPAEVAYHLTFLDADYAVAP